LPETYLTVWSNVFDRGGLREGEVFLVHGGSSGIGTTAIQLAREFGARVFATAGSLEKCRACEELGAERAINYREEDYLEVARLAAAEDPEGQGADHMLDMVEGDYIPRDVKLLRPDGRPVLTACLGSSATSGPCWKPSRCAPSSTAATPWRKRPPPTRSWKAAATSERSC